MKRALIVTLASLMLVGVCYVSSITNLCLETPSGRFCSRSFFVVKEAYAGTLTRPLREDLSETDGDDSRIIRLAEHTRLDDTAYPDGSERYLVHVATSPGALCLHWWKTGTLDLQDCLAPHKRKVVTLDYSDDTKSDVICIKGSNKITGEDVCFSYYDITER